MLAGAVLGQGLQGRAAGVTTFFCMSFNALPSWGRGSCQELQGPPGLPGPIHQCSCWTRALALGGEGLGTGCTTAELCGAGQVPGGGRWVRGDTGRGCRG